MRVFFIILGVAAFANAQQLVNSFTVTPDTTQSHYSAYASSNSYSSPLTTIINGNNWDIYEMLSGKLASVPIVKQSSYSTSVTLSVTLLNVNNGWLSLYILYDTAGYAATSKIFSFKVYNGATAILSDSSFASYFYSGGYCYVYSYNYYNTNQPFNYKVWKLGAAPGAIASLPKQVESQTAQASMVPAGLKIMTHNNPDGTTTIQLFEISGRLAFSGKISNDKPAIIPSFALPNSPFVANVGGSVSNLFIKIK